MMTDRFVMPAVLATTHATTTGMVPNRKARR